MSEYTPTTEEIIEEWTDGSVDVPESRKQFFRWLAAHDAEVRADEAVQWAQAVIVSGEQGERIGAARAGVVAEEPVHAAAVSVGSGEPYQHIAEEPEGATDV